MTATASPQEAIYLRNPSFEANPQYASIPGGWRNCAFNDYSPPDVHPVKGGPFHVTQKPQHGVSYLGLVARASASVESIGQRLDRPFKAGQCYSLSLYLCRSDTLLSAARNDRRTFNFNGTLILRIWGGFSPCGQKSLLIVSPPVANTDWKKFIFLFRPTENFTWISFEAFYVDGTKVAYDGNILLDNASPIVPIDCETTKPLIDGASLHPPEYSFKKIERLEKVKSKLTRSAFNGSDLFMDMRDVEKREDLESLILENCPGIGFRFSRSQFTDEVAYNLKEVAVNVAKFKDQILMIGIPKMGEALVKRRIKKIKQTFREIGLPKRQYRIELLPPNAPPGDGWMCGQKEIWLKLG